MITSEELGSQGDKNTSITSEPVGRYYRDLELLLERVEASKNHYQVLGIERSASPAEIKAAYAKAVGLIEPIYDGRVPGASPGIAIRARRVLGRIAGAFSLLSSIARRLEYDRSALRRPSGNLPPLDVRPDTQLLQPSDSENRAGRERRREPRHAKAEPIHIKYLDGAIGQVYQEVAVTENVSSSGARICVKSAPSHVNLVNVTNMTRDFESLAVVCNRYAGTDGFERLCLNFLGNKWAY